MKAKRKPRRNRVASNDRLDWLSEYFRKQRFSATNHLGLGDIRLTIGQQEHILKKLRQSNAVLSGWPGKNETGTEK